MNECLSEVCRDYPYVKFCRMLASKAGVTSLFVRRSHFQFPVNHCRTTVVPEFNLCLYFHVIKESGRRARNSCVQGWRFDWEFCGPERRIRVRILSRRCGKLPNRVSISICALIRPTSLRIKNN